MVRKDGKQAIVEIARLEEKEGKNDIMKMEQKMVDGCTGIRRDNEIKRMSVPGYHRNKRLKGSDCKHRMVKKISWKLLDYKKNMARNTF